MMVPDRIFILNLPYKPERRIRLAAHLAELDLFPADRIVWMRALSGDWSPPPDWWTSGNGAWGCLMSHVHVGHTAIMEGLDHYLVLEDDVVFHPRAREILQRLFDDLPTDWDQVYLGGQHLARPRNLPGRPFVQRGSNINRTHAYLLRDKVFARFQQHVLHAPDYMAHPGAHLDHQLGVAHQRPDWNVYCPAWWVCGQEAGTSNISGRETPRMWWQPSVYSRHLPFVFVSREMGDALPERTRQSLHFGHNPLPGTLEDEGLSEAMMSDARLQSWLAMIAGEAMDQAKLPALQHADLGSLDRLRQLWPAGVHPLQDAPLERWIDYPWNGLFEHPLNHRATPSSDASCRLIDG